MSGFYNTARPVDGSYTEQLVVHIALPRGSTLLRTALITALVLTLGKLGIAYSGSMDPVDALKYQQNQEHKKA